MADYAIEPWGDSRVEWMLAQLTSTVANLLCTDPARLRKTSDFLPRFVVPGVDPDDEEAEETAIEQRARVDALAAKVKAMFGRAAAGAEERKAEGGKRKRTRNQ